MAAADTLPNDIDNLHITDTSTQEGQADAFVQRWGFNLEDMYKTALKFFKENEGKTLQLTYKDKLRLLAYTKQVAHGKYKPDAMPAVGFLDVVGNDRRQAWQALGDMPKETAMTEFVQQLDAKSSQFKPFVQTLKAEEEEKRQKEKESEEVEEKKRRQEEEEALRRKEIEKQRQQDQEMQIRAALNQQTAAQFRQYVQEQYPYNPQLQDTLIEHLQEQHYQQYMQQVYQQQVLHQQQQFQQLQKMQQDQQSGNNKSDTRPVSGPLSITNGINSSGDGSSPEEDHGTGGQEAELPPLAAASMWTRKDFREFKNSLGSDKDSVIKIDSGESVTVRVPTHEEGTCLFWEFATDHYDIGFGVYFEWTISPSNTVSVHVSESSDDEEELEDEERSEGKGDDVEKGGKTPSDKPPTDEIIPVYRRDCHEEVYCGSHVYPGRGVYLLKFDNSYSLWRSKTLYYRVYYSR